MCTATWHTSAKNYNFFFNRDELLSRTKERHPQASEYEGVSYIAPIDPPSNGTWLFVNQYGLSVGLLNHYPLDYQAFVESSTISRGSLVQSLISSKNIKEIKQRLEARDLKFFKPFTIITFDLLNAACIWQWNGILLKKLFRTNKHMPLTSSSFHPKEIESFRKKLFLDKRKHYKGITETEFLQNFHKLHIPEKPAHSILMQRPDAQTSSFCQITVDSKMAKLRYSLKNSNEPKWLETNEYFLEISP